MKKNYQPVIWGIALIAVGIYMILSITNKITISIWGYVWPTIIVFAGISSLANSKKNVFGYLLLLVGIFFIIKKAVGFSFNTLYIIPILFIIIGITLIINIFSNKNGIKPSNNIFVFFSGRDEKNFPQDYKGSNITCIFGGCDLDFRNYNFTNDISINIFTMFGGTDITLPENVNIIIHPTAIFGGVDNVTTNNNDNEFTVYINGLCMFGGIDINNYKKQK